MIITLSQIQNPQKKLFQSPNYRHLSQKTQRMILIKLKVKVLHHKLNCAIKKSSFTGSIVCLAVNLGSTNCYKKSKVSILSESCSRLTCSSPPLTQSMISDHSSCGQAWTCLQKWELCSQDSRTLALLTGESQIGARCLTGKHWS